VRKGCRVRNLCLAALFQIHGAKYAGGAAADHCAFRRGRRERRFWTRAPEKNQMLGDEQVDRDRLDHSFVKWQGSQLPLTVNGGATQNAAVCRRRKRSQAPAAT